MEYRIRKHYKKKRRHFIWRGVLSIVVVAVLILGGRKFYSLADQRASIRNVKDSGTKDNLNASTPNTTIDLENLYSPYSILTDLDSGNILAEHNAKDRIYPASLTKIMTAILAIENTQDMEEVMTLPMDFFSKLYIENASMAGFQPGEQVRLKDLLYGMLLPSGAECCLAFCERIAGSEEAFVRLMNQKAGELGLENTHFSNSTGLPLQAVNTVRFHLSSIPRGLHFTVRCLNV